MIHWQYVQGHSGNGINIDFGIHELQHHSGKKAGFPCIFRIQITGAFKNLPCKKQHIGGPQNLHDYFDSGKKRVQGRAEKGAYAHDHSKAGQNAQVKPVAAAKAQPGGIAHGKQVVRSRRVCGDKAID